MKPDKLILDLCGGTGAWSLPYKNAGYSIEIVTLPEKDVRFYEPPSNVYGVLAAPPCTMFSFARTRAKKPRCFYEGMEAVEACLRIIWKIRKNDCLKFWALENPRGYLRHFLGKPAMTFKPCEFGNPWSKVTDLWGFFNFPKKNKLLTPVEKGQHRASRWHDLGGNRSERRSITPDGFAKAFFEANR